MGKRKRTTKEGQALRARTAETVEKAEAVDPFKTPTKLETELQLASERIADLERSVSNLATGYGSDLSAEEGAMAASSPAERRAAMIQRAGNVILVPRTDPDSWKIEPAEIIPGVPQHSKLVGHPISELESQYDVKISVLEGDAKVLTPFAFLHVSGSGIAVEQFFNDLTAA